MYRRVTINDHRLAATSDVPLDRVCEHLQKALDTDPFAFDGESKWDWGETFTSSWHLNITRDTSLTLLRYWEGAPQGTNYLITLRCARTESSQLLARLTDTLQAVLEAQVHYLGSFRPVHEWRRQDPPSRWFLPMAWILFLGLVVVMVFLFRACGV